MKQLAIGLTLCMSCAAFAGGPKPQLQVAPVGQRMVPIEVAGARLINGEVVLTTGWMPYGEVQGGGGIAGTPGACVGTTYSTCDFNSLVFDTFEPNLGTGAPADTTGECVAAGVPAGSRYYFGTTVNPPNPNALNDMEVCPGAAGAHAGGVDIAWFFGFGVSRNMSLAVFTNENFLADCSAAPSGGYAGVVLNFGNNTGSQAGYYYTNVNLCGSALFWQMPNDGAGGYQLQIGQFVSPTFTLDVTPGTQPMLWGDQNEPVSAGLAPSEIQWDDDTPRDKIFQAPTECYNYAYGLCIDPLGICLAFRALGSACEPCDTNCDGTINLFDIDPFVAQLSPGPPTPCSPCAADTNGDGTINLFDIDPFVACLSG